MKKVISCVFVILSLVVLANAQSSERNLMVVRVGTGDSALTSSSTQVFLDEYTKEGVFVRTIPLPADTNGQNMPFTISGTAYTEGSITLSENGYYLTLAGYAAKPGVPGINLTNSNTINRIIARVDGNGNISTSTRIKNFFSGGSIRGAATDNGTRYWVTGNSSNNKGAGVVYIEDSDSIVTQILNTPNNTRCVSISNGQLYITSSTGSYKGVLAVGQGLPTEPGQTASPLAGFDTANADPYTFCFNSSGNICYVADGRSLSNGGGIQKWVYQDTLWRLAYTLNKGITSRIFGLTANFGLQYPKIYITTQNQILEVEDKGDTSSAIVLVTASANTAFRGISFAPISTSEGIELKYSQPGKYYINNFPNPFNPETFICYEIPKPDFVIITVYDILGRHVKTLVNEFKLAGKYSIKFSGEKLTSGIYFYSLRTSSIFLTGKMLLLR